MDKGEGLCCSQHLKQAAGAGKEDLSQFTCPNRACRYYGKAPAAGGKLWVDRQRGPDKIRWLRCAHCRKPCSARRGTALAEARLPAAEGEKKAHEVTTADIQGFIAKPKGQQTGKLTGRLPP